jgi:hypothetical protein
MKIEFILPKIKWPSIENRTRLRGSCTGQLPKQNRNRQTPTTILFGQEFRRN